MSSSRPAAGLEITVDQAAELFTVTVKTIREWIREGMPVLKLGGKGAGNGARIDSAAALAWVVARRRRNPRGQHERARLDKETADKLAMENAATRSDLARPEVMQRELAVLYAAYRKRALAIPPKLAPQLVGLDADAIRSRIEQAVHGLLTWLADYRPGASK